MTAIALTIAGSDSSGGAGIQADLKTFSALGVYGASVITAITAQNTQGVSAVEDVSTQMIEAQVKAVLNDLDVAAIKIGMVSRASTIGTLARLLGRCQQPIVIDPVMVATSGDRLLQEDALVSLRDELLPLAHVVTPNLPEAALLTGTAIATDRAATILQAEAILSFGPAAVLIKGGHSGANDPVDRLLTGSGLIEIARPRITTTNDHGTGCTLAAAITATLATGLALEDATTVARDYLQGALAAGRDLGAGKGHGPVHHFYRWWKG